MDNKDTNIKKLSKFLIHWAKHNNSHKANFIKWRDIAKSYELITVVDNLNKSIEMMDNCSKYLLSAHKELVRKK
ncbi:MAG: hypothetical protein ACTSWY_06480 [Promethearchaeota archaeon]